MAPTRKSLLTTLNVVGVIVSVAVLAVNLVRSKIKGTSQVLVVGTLYGAIFALLFLAPLPQINSQSDMPDIPAFPGTSISPTSNTMSSHLRILNGCTACLLLHCRQLIVPASFG